MSRNKRQVTIDDCMPFYIIVIPNRQVEGREVEVERHEERALGMERRVQDEDE